MKAAETVVLKNHILETSINERLESFYGKLMGNSETMFVYKTQFANWALKAADGEIL
ncbi:hypothetical protein [Escherichia coli]|uniref:hypothetical protein n=1 Tax=Escherichia coli TaxID=562 RepID=UPI0012FE18AF|nr:hypothetical protein [Escherichia coli]